MSISLSDLFKRELEKSFYYYTKYTDKPKKFIKYFYKIDKQKELYAHSGTAVGVSPGAIAPISTAGLLHNSIAAKLHDKRQRYSFRY